MFDAVFVKHTQTGNRVNENIGYIYTFNMFYFRLTKFNHNKESLIPQ